MGATETQGPVAMLPTAWGWTWFSPRWTCRHALASTTMGLPQREGEERAKSLTWTWEHAGMGAGGGASAGTWEGLLRGVPPLSVHGAKGGCDEPGAGPPCRPAHLTPPTSHLSSPSCEHVGGKQVRQHPVCSPNEPLRPDGCFHGPGTTPRAGWQILGNISISGQKE